MQCLLPSYRQESPLPLLKLQTHYLLLLLGNTSLISPSIASLESKVWMTIGNFLSSVFEVAMNFPYRFVECLLRSLCKIKKSEKSHEPEIESEIFPLRTLTEEQKEATRFSSKILQKYAGNASKKGIFQLSSSPIILRHILSVYMKKEKKLGS